MNSFGAKGKLAAGGREWEIFRLSALAGRFDVASLPYALKVLLENLLRCEDGVSVTASDVEALASWDPAAEPSREIQFMPARVLLQDFTGVPAVVDLAAMRDAMSALGGDPKRVNPLIPAELVIDHSVMVDYAASREAFGLNAALEFQRNQERYKFLRWGQQAFKGFSVVPPDTGIVHQVNLEHLARVVFTTADGKAYPDTLVGTDSHTPMVNGLGVLGWGVGGIEAEAAMLGEPVSMLIPQVVGMKLEGQLPEGSTATDLVLTVTQLLRKHGVVGKFVEFYGPGVGALPLADRATIGNMSPEYGSTCAIFPIDEETLRYLRFTGRSKEHVALVEAYAKEQGLFHDPAREPRYTTRLTLDLSTVKPCIAGPSRPQDRVPLDKSKSMFAASLAAMLPETGALPVASEKVPFAVKESAPEFASAASFPASDPPSAGEAMEAKGVPNATPQILATRSDRPHKSVPVTLENGVTFTLDHGHVVIAAITSCTNTSNPSVMVAAGLLARNAVAKGLRTKPWVKTSLAPGSQVVTAYYEKAGLTEPLEKLGFHLVGYGCTTCIGNSGPLPPAISKAVEQNGLNVVSVLSGNRNFEGRINPDCRMNYLASPPLVVAYALAGTMDIDLYNEPLGQGHDGPVYLRDIWPSAKEVQQTVDQALASGMFERTYADVFKGDERWRSLPVPSGDRFAWDKESTYIRQPPYFANLSPQPAAVADIRGARALLVLGDSVTTDHISPAGTIKPKSAAGQWLIAHGVDPADFNSYGARRGNHEVMIRGTFANSRIKNKLVPGVEGSVTVHLPDGAQMNVYDAAMRYAEEGVPLVVLAGKEYGSGSSRDWAAKGTALLGIRAVIAESYERIHRSNLVGMGVLPLQLQDGATLSSLGLTGKEVFDIPVGAALAQKLSRIAIRADGREIPITVRIDTPKEWEYFRHGGILPYVLRRLRAA